jgi:rubredoxin
MSSTLQKYKCPTCDYIYDPSIGDEEANISPGTSFEDLPEDWVCPDCGEPKEEFEPFDG